MIFLLVRGENKGECFLRLGVVDREKKISSIFIPKGRGAKGGWALLLEALRGVDVASERQVRQKDKEKPWKPLLGKSFAEVVKQPCSNGEAVVRVEVDNRDLSQNLKKLAHRLVGCWDPKLGRPKWQSFGG